MANLVLFVSSSRRNVSSAPRRFRPRIECDASRSKRFRRQKLNIFADAINGWQYEAGALIIASYRMASRRGEYSGKSFIILFSRTRRNIFRRYTRAQAVSFDRARARCLVAQRNYYRSLVRWSDATI